MLRFVEKLYHDAHEDTPESPEVMFYWDKLFETVEALADPKYDKKDVSNRIYEIVAPYGIAQRNLGWERGIAFALRLVADTLHTPDTTAGEAKEQYERSVQSRRCNAVRRV